MIKINVEDMTCMACVRKVQRSLLTSGINGDFDVMNKTVKVSKNDQDKAIELIKNAGYTPKI